MPLFPPDLRSLDPVETTGQWIFDAQVVFSANVICSGQVSFSSTTAQPSFPFTTRAALAGADADPPAVGAIGKVRRIAQTAAIATTNLTGNACPVGIYVVNYILADTTAAAGGSATLTIAWTDRVGATTKTATQVLTGTGRTTDPPLVIYMASGNITYAVALAGVIGSPQYALDISTVYLG